MFTLGALFILLNSIAAFHAWKFTHFQRGAAIRTREEAQLSFSEKLSAVFFGVGLPRLENTRLPQVPYETLILKGDHRIECWWLPADSACGTVVLCHGYGGSKSAMLEKAYIFRSLHYNVLLPDFPGAGGSEGNACTIGWTESGAVTRCVEYLAENGAQNIVLSGVSMGAAAIMKSMQDERLPVKAVVLECPYGTMLHTVQNRFNTVGLSGFPLANMLVFWGGVENGFNAFSLRPEDYARAIHCPALLIWGGKDPKVSRGETDTIFARLAGPKRLLTLPEAGHNDYLLRYRKEWICAVDSVLRMQ